ncbi:lactonase family protein [Dysgonomonas sp. 511]|uniref:lactonase family protein n=1 Tax=Dysgonomonas sp. 511 TaxID=2302930 RepID=UPI0013D766F1|nr:lactonase family protein [Dysgonomonas sp. 511]NDV79401.1 lactonase family protein [Dysgonomonas sp. 511]
MKKYVFFIFLSLIMVSCNNKKKRSNTDLDDIEMAVAAESSMFLLVGTYTDTGSEGIYVYRFDTISGNSELKSLARQDNPSYLNLSNDERFVYAVSEGEGDRAVVAAYSFDKGGDSLRLMNTMPTGGDAPCYVVADKDNRYLVTANYSGASISLFPLVADGSIGGEPKIFGFEGKGIHPERQKRPHLHCVQFSPDDRYLYATDLGTDRIYKFQTRDSGGGFLMKGEPESFKVADGSGPRHLTFHPDGKFAYLINEIGGTVIGFNYNEETGDLSEFQTIVADTLHAQGSGDIHVSPDGKFLYASNRLQGDGIAIFSIDRNTGKLENAGYQPTGIHPRNFVISPNGKYLLVANRDSNMIQVFLRNKATGLLETTGLNIELDKPVCLKFAHSY